jgi:hypothetical protein
MLLSDVVPHKLEKGFSCGLFHITNLGYTSAHAIRPGDTIMKHRNSHND